MALDPANLTPLSPELWLPASYALVESVGALGLGQGHEIEFACAGHVYDRKGYDSFDSLERERNRSYGSAYDDMLLVVGIRVPCYGTDTESINRLKDAVKAFQDGQLLADIKAAEDKLEQAQQELDMLRLKRSS